MRLRMNEGWGKVDQVLSFHVAPVLRGTGVPRPFPLRRSNHQMGGTPILRLRFVTMLMSVLVPVFVAMLVTVFALWRVCAVVVLGFFDRFARHDFNIRVLDQIF